jgi:aminoglycoside 3-N-acetyltransferase
MNKQPTQHVVTRSQLEHDLRALGIAAGDVVMLHASVKSIGWIVGGPEVVLHAIMNVLGTSGTLMMMAGWEDYPYKLEEWDEDRRQAYLEFCPAFDPHSSRANWREMSILAEYLRTTPGATRSAHPISSYTAWGADAAELTRDHVFQYHHGLNSPLARFCHLGGKVLLLGDLFENITLLHHAEHLAAVPNKRVVRYQMPVLQDGKRVWINLEEYDTSKGIADWSEDYFAVIGESFLEDSLGKSGRVGHAPAHVYDAHQLLAYGIAWMETNLITS